MWIRADLIVYDKIPEDSAGPRILYNAAIHLGGDHGFGSSVSRWWRGQNTPVGGGSLPAAEKMSE